MQVEINYTAEEHANRLGGITQPVVDKVNLRWHENTIKKLASLGFRDIEVKKDIVYKGAEMQ